MIPYVPHLFVQRVDALPEYALEGALTNLGDLEQSASRSSSLGPGWLRQLGGGQGSGSARGERPQSKADVRELLKKRHQEEVAADADTADYSSEPYDSIPRQVQLQWRVYAKLFPEEVAAEAKLASLLGPRTGTQTEALGTPTVKDHREDIWAAPAALFTGFLPSAGALQKTLRSLAPQSATPRSGVVGAATAAPPETAAAGGNIFNSNNDSSGGGGGVMGIRSAAGKGPIHRPVPKLGARATQEIILGDGREPGYLQDPTFQQLRASLDAWYQLHLSLPRPIRRGRRARVLALRGVDIPAEWKGSLRPARGDLGRPTTAGAARAGGVARGVLHWSSAAVSMIGGLLGLRRAPRVWDVNVAGRVRSNGQGQQQRQQQELPLGVGGFVSGKGLAVAQAAALRMNFSLRRTELVPPEWL